MNPESIIDAWLQDASITSIVGRAAVGQLPQNKSFPGLVYSVITAFPEPTIDAQNKSPQLAQARIQFNPLAKDIATVKAIMAALRSLLDFKHQVTIDGKLVMSMRLIDCGPAERDADSGIWTQPIDYRLRWYE